MRTRLPDDIAADVMFQHARTCCVCTDPSRAVQIHHIDNDPSNHDPSNLAVLCLEDHESTQVRGGFSRKLRAADVIKHRDEWLRRVRERREAADKVVVERMVAAGVADVTSRAEAQWSPASNDALAAFINTLPDTLRFIHQQAQPFFESIGRLDMLHGAQIVIDVLEQSWIQLSAWFPPNHFGSKPAGIFFSEYLANRSIWNAALGEPDGFGTGGREASIISQGETMADADRAVVDTVRALATHRLEDFDFDEWIERWEAAKDQRQ